VIKESEVFRIGRITRTRGICGEVEMSFTDDVFDRGTAEYFVLKMDGLFVPFFWNSYRFKNGTTLILKLEDCDSEKKAKRLVGTGVFYPLSSIPEEEKTWELSSYQALTGFRVKDAKGEILGEIVRVDDTTPNILLALDCTDHKERLLPYHDDFLISYDFKSRQIQLELPEGLLEIN